MVSQFPYLSGSGFDTENAEILRDLEAGEYGKVLSSEYARRTLGTDNTQHNTKQFELQTWKSHVLDYVHAESNESKRHALLLIGHAALQAFLQSNVTGPPLTWKPSELCLPASLQPNETSVRSVHAGLISDLSVDGEAVYHLTPYIELFYIAKIILTPENICGQGSFRWARVRVNFWHQNLLNENAASLQDTIYGDLLHMEGLLLGAGSEYPEDVKAAFLIEKALIQLHHGFEKKARDDLEEATKLRRFEYLLTGRLGKRTKFQQQEISQLVVLAKSRDEGTTSEAVDPDPVPPAQGNDTRPANVDLNDDTLLESISFSKTADDIESVRQKMPSSLASLDPADQPILNSLDSIILLSYASSITNTSPEDGLTREETLPYAVRVLEGGSSNWQVYTQALLVRSRIEGYRSRTVERGVLQLQALVDQVIVETTGGTNEPGEATEESNASSRTTFLPRAKPSESAPVQERLQYINQLASPPRWSLEAELAARWVTLGGLRTALEIYERLEMWAEAALCWAATDREDKAIRMVRKQLYRPGRELEGASTPNQDEVEDSHYGVEKDQLPADAARLFCILGDIEKSAEHYERAWTVSKNRYARAQRSLGKHYMSSGDLLKAEDAYSLSLKANPQNAGIWFTLGCVRIEMRNWKGAVNAFSRTISSEPEDGEAWSNLAAALLRLSPDEIADGITLEGDDHANEKSKRDPQKHVKEAFVAFKRAATLKRDSYRIWQNVLNVAATISPPPYADVIVAQQRLIELRGDVEGEQCVDVEIMEGLLAHIIATNPPHGGKSAVEGVFDSSQEDKRTKRYGLERTFTELVTRQVAPLITRSRRLWQLVARLSIHLNRPSSALDAYEKAWRLTLNQPGWDDGSTGGVSLDVSSFQTSTPEEAWDEVVDATIELVDAYESLGEREVTEGLRAGSGELVCKNWQYKGRMAVRSVIGRRTKAGLEGMETLKARMEDLKGGS